MDDLTVNALELMLKFTYNQTKVIYLLIPKSHKPCTITYNITTRKAHLITSKKCNISASDRDKISKNLF
ncbi:hypothetical protein ZONE111905_20130 [Zobellia nedashkovskayae]